MFISILKKIRAKSAATEDSHGAYGKYILAQAQQVTYSEPLNLSRFMEHLVMSYRKKSRKFIDNKSIHKLYLKIMNECENLNKQTKEYETQIINIKEQIGKILEKKSKYDIILKKLEDYWADVNQTGCVLPEMGVANMGELKTYISEVKTQIKNLDNESSKLQKDLNAIKEKQSEISYSDLNNLILSYKRKFHSLCIKADRTNDRYDEYLSYYWCLLRKKIEKHTRKIDINQKITLYEICKSRGVYFVAKDSLLEKERMIINNQINRFPIIKINV